MEDNKSNITEPVKGISIAATIGSLTAILVNVVKAYYPLGDPASSEYTTRQEWQNIWVSIVIFTVPLFIQGLVFLFKYFFVTPDEERLRERLNADLEEYGKTFKDIKTHPERYTENDIAKFREEYAETRRQLHNIGKR
ncbi:hypothetical protein [Actinobacillus porcinus]|uniref:hypothetical protein n=1 Tax=Actinobacillus TaxID=713 RepID=UPI0023F54F1B|nr:hypothetical protein [Actinobacillus porcinus]MDD7545205.1 hypothetical protein [Actinobacillus porcinus]MDY5847137.1 hypothetical protein [Actinobacillus porcinus]